MSRANYLLRELTAELGDVKIQSRNSQKQLERLLLTKSGHLRIVMDDGQEHVVPHMSRLLNENVIYTATRVARNLKKRGIIGGVLSFFRLIVTLVLLVIIATLVLIILGIRALIPARRSQLKKPSP